eukprot:6126190-Amphidinium_carterae.1
MGHVAVCGRNISRPGTVLFHTRMQVTLHKLSSLCEVSCALQTSRRHILDTAESGRNAVASIPIHPISGTSRAPGDERLLLSPFARDQPHEGSKLPVIYT